MVRKMKNIEVNIFQCQVPPCTCLWGGGRTGGRPWMTTTMMLITVPHRFLAECQRLVQLLDLSQQVVSTCRRLADFRLACRLVNNGLRHDVGYILRLSPSLSERCHAATHFRSHFRPSTIFPLTLKAPNFTTCVCATPRIYITWQQRK